MTKFLITNLPQNPGQQKRIRGLDAHKANIQAARAVANILRTSLGE